VWSQGATQFAFEKRTISSESYFEITGALVEAGYAFTMIGHLDFLYELKKTAWKVSPRLEKLSNFLRFRQLTSEVCATCWPDS